MSDAPREPRAGDPLLSVRGLEKHYPITEGVLKNEVGRVRAVDGIDFDVYEGETFGIVGESGCGKSTAANSLIRLEEPTGGEVRFRGEDVTEYTDEELKRFRRDVQMIFQDPDSSFDPRMSVGESIAEPLTVQGFDDKEKRREIVADLLERVGLSADDADRYPHEFSGGQKQRIGLARALSVNPDVIVADEPVSALDVSIQAEILSLMNDLQEAFGLTIVVISHNLSVIRQVCDRVAVMYLGEIVEMGPTERLFTSPEHPYTRALMSSIPTPDPNQRGMGVELTGDVPSPSSPPPGCRFHTRCPEVILPEGVEIGEETFQHVLDLRQRIRADKIDVDSVRESIAREADYEDPDAVPDDEVAAQLRAEYDLADPLDDSEAERTLDEAASALARGDVEDAGATLQETFATPCEETHPELQSVGDDHVAACLLHDREETRDPGEDVSSAVSGDD